MVVVTAEQVPAIRVAWLLRLPYAVRNVVRRWRGLLGMMLGVGIALGIGMTMLAISSAAIELYTADFRRSGADLYVVQEGATLIPRLLGETPGTIKNARHTLSQVRALPEVDAAVGVVSWAMERERPGPRRRDEATELVVAMGVDGDPTLIPAMLDLTQGRWLRRSDETVVGPKLGREKGLGPEAAIRLNGRDFTVVGVGKLRGFGFGSDAVAYLDYRAFRQRAEVGDVVSIIAVDTPRPAQARERIEALGSLATFDPAELVREAEEVNATATAMRWIIILLTLTIAALFVSNMLSRSVIERRLEFATLRAIGLPSRTILFTVGGEAALVSIVASFVGVGVSLLLGALINGVVAPAYGIESLYAPDAKLFLIVFMLALGLGVVSGVFPARRATRVDPVEVLREA